MYCVGHSRFWYSATFAGLLRFSFCLVYIRSVIVSTLNNNCSVFQFSLVSFSFEFRNEISFGVHSVI